MTSTEMETAPVLRDYFFCLLRSLFGLTLLGLILYTERLMVSNFIYWQQFCNSGWFITFCLSLKL